MAVRIRLRRMGAKKQPSYRLVVADARAPRDGRFIDVLGYYNPLREPAEVVVDEEKALMWLGRGAQPTQTARDLLARLGILAKFQAQGGRIIVVPEPEREVREEAYTEAPLEKLAVEAAGEAEAMAEPTSPEAREEEAAEAGEVAEAMEAAEPLEAAPPEAEAEAEAAEPEAQEAEAEAAAPAPPEAEEGAEAVETAPPTTDEEAEAAAQPAAEQE